ncbi:Smr/MutS family protein [Bacteroidia bacterium]|nr:Smr/MutS family protein [Bacteroidia bacterium]MDC1395758.1 Smr/MutS family protein [Bacteroidia bacterium]
MLYPKSIANKLGFDQVITAAMNHCQTQKGIAHFNRIKCSGNEELIKLWLMQTAELKEIIEKGELAVSLEIDFDFHLESARIEGFFYEIDTINEIQDLLYALQKVCDYTQSHNEEYPLLRELFKSIDIDFELIEDIDAIIGLDNEIKSDASPGLKKIVSAITRAEKNIIKSSNSLFTAAKEKGFLGDTELGIKNGRVVLPVLSEYKRKIGGVLIDQSGTGKISYIEPLELVGLNNELSELQIKKRQEIIAILKNITKKIVVYIEDIRRGVQKLAVFDFIRAKARLASDWNCILPALGSDTKVFDAKHPLLRERLVSEDKEIVSLNYILDSDQQIIVISGPNAGGKSVSLKTIGLMQFMLQSGFLVPCLSTSVFRVFENIFVDIGDDQSIESDLSTYSSHLKAAKHIINFSDSETLVMMDEIGTGTDPMFGGPMAEAILEAIHKKGAFGVITTHFSNIKAKADKLKGLVNAAMMFDIENLVPLYKLQVGQPGSSFVYEVASNIGLNKKLIKRAKQLTNTKQYDLDALLAEVQTKQEALDVERSALAEKLKNASLVEAEYKELKNILSTTKKEILDQAKGEAQKLIKDANKDIERTIRVIKETKADKEKTKKIREDLEQKIEDDPIDKIEENQTSFKVGDQVQLISTNSIGEILELKKNKAILQVGSLTTKTNIYNLERVGVKTEKAVKKYISTSSYSSKQASFRAEKDIRGMRTYDAMNEIDTWIDSAVMLDVGSLRVLHGKGNGILKTELRRHLKGHPSIKSISYERVDLGGEGISIIELR